MNRLANDKAYLLASTSELRRWGRIATQRDLTPEEKVYAENARRSALADAEVLTTTLRMMSDAEQVAPSAPLTATCELDSSRIVLRD